MKTYRWSHAKNEQLKRGRGISFEDVVLAIESGGLLDILEHPNRKRYPNQAILIIASAGYVYLVPYVEGHDHLFLKTVIPSRKATREYGMRIKK